MIVAGVLSFSGALPLAARGIYDWTKISSSMQIMREKVYSENHNSLSPTYLVVRRREERLREYFEREFEPEKKEANFELACAGALAGIGYALLRAGTQKEPVKIVKIEPQTEENQEIRIRGNGDSDF